VVLLDNRGFGCINRLQQGCGGDAYNNLLESRPVVDFAAHARALGAAAEHVPDLAALRPALDRARRADRTAVVVIETDPQRSTQAGGTWWDVPIAEVSESTRVRDARTDYARHRGES
jgi:3D-(3,5/4)-trihydroxycyclohexane-1,2-dione acylhydrolase (decyclizing)